MPEVHEDEMFKKIFGSKEHKIRQQLMLRYATKDFKFCDGHVKIPEISGISVHWRFLYSGGKVSALKTERKLGEQH
jgi:hypothetical protein